MKLVRSGSVKKQKYIQELPIHASVIGAVIYPKESTVTLQEIKEAIEIDGGEKFLNHFKCCIMTRFPPE